MQKISRVLVAFIQTFLMFYSLVMREQEVKFHIFGQQNIFKSLETKTASFILGCYEYLNNPKFKFSHVHVEA